MSDWQALAELPLRVEDYSLERLDANVRESSARVTSVIGLHGGGEEGLGEDVTYGVEDHDALHAAPRTLALAGSWTLGAFTEHVGRLDQFPRPPGHDAYRRYRNWAFESAALDLALRQAGEPLHAVLGRPPRPSASSPRCASMTRRRSPPRGSARTAPHAALQARPDAQLGSCAD